MPHPLQPSLHRPQVAAPGRWGMVWLAAALFLGTTAPAHAAYIDPGSGSLLLQAIAAGIFGCLYFFRRAFSRLWGIFKRPSGSKADDPERR